MGNGKAMALRVLVADDEPHIRAVVVRIVEALGAEVVAEAGDGRQAVDLFLAHRPDVVILDVNMPLLTGDRALARMVQADPRVVAVMMTAQDTADAVRGCLDLGARDYILKSTPAQEIFHLLKEAWPQYEREVRDRVPS